MSYAPTLPALADPGVRSSATDPGEVSPRLLRCFVVLAEELHFGRAADRLYVAQPALSRSIQQLERVLGQRLFVRTTRSVELTPSAQGLLPAAREVLDALSLLAGEVASGQRTLRVAHLPGSDTMALILDQLSRDDPAMPVEEQVMAPTDQLVALREGRLDVALCRAPAAATEPDLRSELVRLDPLLVAVIGRDPAERRPVDPRRRSVVLPDGGGRHRDLTRFVSAFTRAIGCSSPVVRVALGSGTEAYTIRRGGRHAFFTLGSNAVHLDTDCAVVGTAPWQAYYPWSMVGRSGHRSAAVAAFAAAAATVSARRGWSDLAALPGDPWLADDTTPERPWTLAA
jgi:DNA-binding transcriptional LysR family regulator